MKQARQELCGCGKQYRPWKDHYGEHSFECRPCRIRGLRRWARDIERLKADIRENLSEPNRERWDQMNSQRKKLFVFQAIEEGMITWTIPGREHLYKHLGEKF